MTVKVFFYFVLTTTINTAYSQTNTLPQNGNVGIGTTSPTSRLQVNGNATIDSSLVVRDSMVIHKGARVKSTLKVDGDAILKSDLLIKQDLKVNGGSNFKGNVVIKEGTLKLKSIRDTTTNEKGLLMIKKDGEVVNGGVLQNIIYSEIIYELACAKDALGNVLYRTPSWEANVDNGMYLLRKNCMNEVRLGVGIKPTARFHVLSPTVTTILPLLIERASGNQAPAYKLLQLDNEGLLYAREVKVNLQAWPDYVFKSEYKLMPLAEVEKFIQTNGHLPKIPSAATIEDEGLNLGEMNKLLMEKIEELTLHLIEQDKKISQLQYEVQKGN